MEPKKTALLLAAVLTIVTLAKSETSPNQLTLVDSLRNEYLRLEWNLWNFVLDQENNEISKSAVAPEIQLISEFEHFGDILYKELPQDIDYGLKSLDSVWIWMRAYSELRGIYALYDSFRRFQKLQTSPGRVASPKQAWLDLTETILNGSNSVTEAEQRLHDYVVKENLFSEVAKVIYQSSRRLRRSTVHQTQLFEKHVSNP